MSLAALALSLAVLVAFVQAHFKRQRARDMQRSNARVLREFKRIARREPNRVFERQE